jgi:TfoX/Sxy family transcriptional regulator of competence genes
MTKETLQHYRQIIEFASPYPPPEVDMTFRSMFGGAGGYVRERIFCVVTGEGLALKFAPDTQAKMVQETPEARHLSWTKLYLIVPSYIQEDEAQFSMWVGRSIDDVLTMPIKKNPRKRKLDYNDDGMDD